MGYIPGLSAYMRPSPKKIKCYLCPWIFEARPSGTTSNLSANEDAMEVDATTDTGANGQELFQTVWIDGNIRPEARDFKEPVSGNFAFREVISKFWFLEE
ncbi:hypothetical protein M9H77_27666 [Catharanthus roseus]|uniref:Uncharacterized protein n=1 Tax=Catharanthus roseus TaxID=4058 RepID=A0ACC0AD59_CATRO|nr:hypothetical protein M9H77_27666 [Catharanthus roseus]